MKSENGHNVGASPRPESLEEYARRLEYRLRLEDAVVRASLLIASRDEPDLGQVLEIIGESTGATHVYLQRVPPGEEPLDAAAGHGTDGLFWTRGEAEPPGGGPDRINSSGARSTRPEGAGRVTLLAQTADAAATFESLLAGLQVQAVPILSGAGRFHGYLGVAGSDKAGERRDEDDHILAVIGDLLASTFDRRYAEEAKLQSEERWRSLVERHPEAILIATGDAILYANPAGQRLLGLGDPADALRCSLLDFISADEYEQVRSRIEAILRGESVEPFLHEVAGLDGVWRIVESHGVCAPFEGKPAAQLVMRDLTERRRSEQRYRTFVETISEGIWHVRMRRPISTTAAPDLQAEHMHREGVLAECNAATAAMLGASGPKALTDRPFWMLEPSTGLADALVRSGYRVTDWSVSRPAEHAQEEHFRVNASAIVERGWVVGIWGSCTDVTATVDLERRMMNTLEEHQQQIGRDLHDGVGQLLTGVRLLGQVLVDSLPASEAEAGNLAGKMLRFAQQASDQVRDIYYGLTPAQLSREGVVSALEELVINSDALPSVRCVFDYDGRTDVNDAYVKLHLYRIVQEAVNNALKHAKARVIRVSFGTSRGCVELCITDDGVGFDPHLDRGKSLGVKSMHYRARAIQGTLSIEAVPGGGMQVCCRIPLGALPRPA